MAESISELKLVGVVSAARGYVELDLIEET